MSIRPDIKRRLPMVTRSIALASSSILVLALVAGISVTPFAQEPKTPLQGVWRTVEVVVPGAPARTYRPAATLAIFHGRHYSRVEVHTEQPRPLLADQASASADQLRAVWGPVVGEAGMFEMSGNNTITMQASVAKNPAAMTPGVQSVFTYRREGDLLILTQLRTPAGPSPDPITIKLTRVE
jgi:hypothetical protein